LKRNGQQSCPVDGRAYAGIRAGVEADVDAPDRPLRRPSPITDDRFFEGDFYFAGGRFSGIYPALIEGRICEVINLQEKANNKPFRSLYL
jgi:hypothetical protein